MQKILQAETNKFTSIKKLTSGKPETHFTYILIQLKKKALEGFKTQLFKIYIRCGPFNSTLEALMISPGT